jgi:hypothetical protein
MKFTMSTWSCARWCCLHALTVVLVLSSAAVSLAAPLDTRFLNQPVAGGRISTYNNAAAAAKYDNNIVVGGSVVGSVLMDYDAFTGTQGTRAIGGANISGGFYLGNATVKPGFTLEWVQTVSATTTGGENIAPKGFDLPATNSIAYPDADPTDAAARAYLTSKGRPAPVATTFAPSYVFTKVQVTPAAPPGGVGAPTLGFTDTPGRGLAPAALQTWTGELGLVAISTALDTHGFHTVDVIASFEYGFTIGAGSNVVTATAPYNFGAPTAGFGGGLPFGYTTTLNSFYGGTSPAVGGNAGVATDLYNFVYDPTVLVPKPAPEPGTLLLLALGAMGLAVGRWRRRWQIAARG